MFKQYNHLGFNNPYYFVIKNRFYVTSCFQNIIAKYNDSLTIDPVSVIELLNKNFMFADRTIIQGIQHTPWMAKPNIDLDGWVFEKVPKHGKLDISQEEIAAILFEKICTEIKLYIDDRKKVGLLLSGGMDSRMVAGALDYIIKTCRIPGIEVTGLTWGNEDTRDVVYAKDIAQRLGWKWKHYTVSAQDLLNNIKETAINGCEYSPIHLHAIPQIRDDNKNIQVILAGSYGDSIGRAEYSGKNVRFIKPILHNIFNVGGFVNQAVYKATLKHIHEDVYRYHQQFPEIEPYMQNELEYQLHYMRRMLNPCMALLTENMDFYQVFTHPSVFGYMWSIRPDKRTNDIYKFMLKYFKTDLSDIPWARTGMPYGQNNVTPDNYLKNNHTYEYLIQKVIINELAAMVLSDELRSLGIFNIDALKMLIKLLKYFPGSNIYYPEKLIWLASIAEMTKTYDIKRFDYFEQNRSFTHIRTAAEYLFFKNMIDIKDYARRLIFQ